MLTVTVISPYGVLFEGRAQRVILPGEQGVFEIQPFHRPMVSRLLSGTIIVDAQCLAIRRGVAAVDRNRITAIVEHVP